MRDAVFIFIGILLASIAYVFPEWLKDKEMILNYVPWAPFYFCVTLLLMLVFRKPLLWLAHKILPPRFIEWFKKWFI